MVLGAVDGEAAADRLDAVAQALQTRAGRLGGPADPVVDDLDGEPVVAMTARTRTEAAWACFCAFATASATT